MTWKQVGEDTQTASPSPAFWDAWRADKEAVKANGYTVSKPNGVWTVTFKDLKKTVEESRALEVTEDIEIPVPENLEYFGYQKAGIWFAKDRNTLIGDVPGLGKAQIHGTKVYTPFGAKNIEDVETGDLVFGRNGKATEVTGVHPQGLREAYRVTFNDGFSIAVDGEHLWYVETSAHARHKTEGLVLTTQQMCDADGTVYRHGVGHNESKVYKISTHYKQGDGSNKWAIPTVEPVEFEGQEVPIDPYLFGVMLGDGTINQYGRVALQLPGHKLAMVDKEPHGVDSRGLNVVYYNEYKQEIVGLGLAGKRSWEKFIPDVYRYNTTAVRLEVLRGLMDTDGHLQASSTEYSTSSKQLCDDVVEIVQSLGGIARVRSRIPRYDYLGEKKEGRESYRVNIKLMQNPFRHRADDYDMPTKYLPKRFIKNIEKLPGLHEATCISVAADDSLYVAEHFIVTHNTIQTAGVINLHKEYQKILVICPNSVKINWKRELTKWLTRSYTIGIVDRNDYPEDTDILIINYDVAARHKEKLQAVEWDLMVLDEAHLVKNPQAKRTQAILGKGKRIPGISAKQKLFLTGTPIMNRPIELFNLIHALDSEEWPSKWKFAHRYCGATHNGYGWDFSGASNLEELNKRLRSTVMIRRTKEEALPELPPVFQQVVELPQTATLRRLIREEQSTWDERQEVMDALRAAVEVAKVSESEEDYRAAVSNLRSGMGAAFAEMSKLRQEIAIQKIPFVLEHLSEVEEKVVVFFHHKEVGRQLKEALGDRAVMLVGDTSVDDRQTAVDAFQNDPRVQFFLGSITAAGVGITLTAASHVVFCELDYRPAMIEQAYSRCQRIGQKDNVLVQYLLTEDSLDVKMAHSIISKLEIIDKALDEVVEDVPLPQIEENVRAPDRKKEVEPVSMEEKKELLRQLRVLSELDTDGARVKNHVGFNKVDSRIGHSLARQGTLSDRQAHLARSLVTKYRRQLEEYS